LILLLINHGKVSRWSFFQNAGNVVVCNVVEKRRVDVVT
jgi:hypothetical protein